MNRKTLIVLTLVFILLAVVATSPQWAKILPVSVTGPKAREIPLVEFTQDLVQEIVITGSDEEARLTKNGTVWKVGDKMASQEEINALFQSFADSQMVRLVSRSKDNISEYAVAENEGVELTIKGTFGESTLYIGKTGPELNSVYLRKKNSDNVYLYKGNLHTVAISDQSKWRDKTIISLPVADVGEITVEGKTNFRLTRTEAEAWTLYYTNVTKRFTSSELNTILTELSTLKAYDFASEEKESLARAPDKTKIILKDKNEGATLVELEVVEQQGAYFVQRKDMDEIYRVYLYVLSDFLKLSEKASS